MHGLTEYENKQVRYIRRLMKDFYTSGDRYDLATAKHVANKFIRANKSRRVIRDAACRSIKFLYAHVK